MIEEGWAKAFAHEWIEAWNSHDLERIMSHYTDDFEMSSPFIIELMGEPGGKLRGKASIRPYWEKGLAAQPPLREKEREEQRFLRRFAEVEQRAAQL